MSSASERKDAERREREQLAFLAEAGMTLSASLDYEETLSAVAHLAVESGLADWCAIEIIERTGVRDQVAVAHRDPSKVDLALDLRQRFPPDPDAPRGVANVLRTGKSEMYPDITPELIAAHVRDPECRRLLEDLGLRSAMIVPMATPERLFGAISFIHAESGGRYDEVDLALAEELGRRASLAVENARLYSAAQRAIRARDDMLAVVSHDLKNPLGIITMQAELLTREEPPTPDRIQAAGARIQRACDRMQRMINDLLDLASLDEGTLRLQLEPTALDGLIRDAIEAQAPAAAANRVVVDAVQIANLQVCCDRERLQRVFANLLTNAIRYTPHGGTVTITSRANGNQVEVAVGDTGNGISPEDLDRIFDRFYRSPDHGKGTGLGLAIARGLVEAHGGRLWATSTPGQGSVFTFTLPLVERVAAPSDPAIRAG